MKAGLILLLALAFAAGILLVLRPWKGGVELVYTLPSNAAAGEAARVLETRSRVLGLEAEAVAVDRRVRLRVAGRTWEDLEPLYEAFVRRGRLEVGPDAHPEVLVLSNADLIPSVSTEVTGSQWILIFPLRPESAALYLKAAPQAASMILRLDGKPTSRPAALREGADGHALLVGLDSENQARVWAAILVGGEIPSIRWPEIGSYRGRLR